MHEKSDFPTDTCVVNPPIWPCTFDLHLFKPPIWTIFLVFGPYTSVYIYFKKCCHSENQHLKSETERNCGLWLVNLNMKESDKNTVCHHLWVMTSISDFRSQTNNIFWNRCTVLYCLYWFLDLSFDMLRWMLRKLVWVMVEIWWVKLHVTHEKHYWYKTL